MASKQPLETQPSIEKEIPKPLEDSMVAGPAVSAADLSSRKADVSPEHPKPLPNDVEVAPAESPLLSNTQSRSSMTVLHFELISSEVLAISAR